MIWKIYERTSKSSSNSTTIGSGCTQRWAIDPRKNSSKRPNPRPNLEARRWSFLRTKRTAKRILKDCWGKGLKCRPLPQTPSPTILQDKGGHIVNQDSTGGL